MDSDCLWNGMDSEWNGMEWIWDGFRMARFAVERPQSTANPTWAVGFVQLFQAVTGHYRAKN